MTNKQLEFVKKYLENALILMDDIKKPVNASDRVMLRQIKDYAVSILNEINKLL